MRLRRPARIFAPLALLAALAAVYILVHNAHLSDSGSSSTTSAAHPAKSANGPNKGGKAARKAPKGPKTYTVQAGDTLTAIAAKEKVSAAQISELNPNLDPQGLQPGDKIKLRP